MENCTVGYELSSVDLCEVTFIHSRKVFFGTVTFVLYFTIRKPWKKFALYVLSYVLQPQNIYIALQNIQCSYAAEALKSRLYT